MPADEFAELGLRVNGNAFGIELSREFRRIEATLNVRDLRCGKSDDVVPGIIPEVNVEIVKVASCGPHDENFFNHHLNPQGNSNFEARNPKQNPMTTIQTFKIENPLFEEWKVAEKNNRAVTPAEAGVQKNLGLLDSRFRGNDDSQSFH
jgi:hypothetical protein